MISRSASSAPETCLRSRTLLVINTRDKSFTTAHTADARPRHRLFRHSPSNGQITESLLDRLINTSHQVLMDHPSYRPRKRPGRADSTATGPPGKPDHAGPAWELPDEHRWRIT